MENNDEVGQQRVITCTFCHEGRLARTSEHAKRPAVCIPNKRNNPLECVRKKENRNARVRSCALRLLMMIQHANKSLNVDAHERARYLDVYEGEALENRVICRAALL